jgi:extracellular factor (EF) 3-hydroxypalmitic acid methyl ester biosynthesis protein
MPPRQQESGGAGPEPGIAGVSASERSLHYTELEGARGRDIFFRPERYPRSELGPVGVAVEVAHDGVLQRCELQDVSQNGFAFHWHWEPVPELGDMLDEVALRFDSHEAYRGQVRVSSIRRHDKTTLVGVSLIDTLMNIDDVLLLRDVKARIAAPDFQGLALAEAPWRVDGQERFKALVAELRLFLEDAEQSFAALEAALPWHVVHGDLESPAREALIERIRTGFVADVVQASKEIDSALRGAPRECREPLRAFSLRQLDAVLMLAPWMHRARHKPLGYPGDFEIMNGLYGRHFSGPTLFAKAMNLAFVMTPAAQAVRNRKDLIRARLEAVLDAHAGQGQPLRILSVAAGPAEEVFGLLEERSSIDVPLEVVLFDQDRSALSFSYARLSRLVAARWQGKVRVVHLHDSITRLLRGSTQLAAAGGFHAVYACGLFDYLQPHTWVTLCRTLFETVAPGGTLYLGNMVPSCPTRWLMEFHLDWYLEYRERVEMLELAHKAAPRAACVILEEPSGVNPFVALTRE